MQHAAAVMHRDVFVDAHRARDAIASRPQKSKMKPWQSDE